MTQLLTFPIKVFASLYGATNVLSQFGSLKENDPNYSTDLDVIQELTNWDNGWSDAVIANYLPALQDLNSVYNVITSQLQYLMTKGIPEYSATTTYYIGSIVSDGNGSIYRSVTDNNVGNAFTSAANWFMVDSNNITSIGTDNYTAINTDYVILWNLGDTGITTPRTIYLPNPATHLKGRKYIIKNIYGSSYGLVIKNVNTSLGFNGNAGSTFVICSVSTANPGGCITLICDGSYWWALNSL